MWTLPCLRPFKIVFANFTWRWFIGKDTEKNIKDSHILYPTKKYTFIRLWKKKRKAEVIIIYSCNIINIVPKSSIFKIRKINRWRLWCDSCCRTTKKELGYPASQIRNFCQSSAILRIVLQHPIFQRCNIILFAKTSNGTRFSRLFEPRLVREISIPRTRRRVVSMRLSYFKEHFNIIYDTAMSVFQVFPFFFLLFSFFFNSLISRMLFFPKSIDFFITLIPHVSRYCYYAVFP